MPSMGESVNRVELIKTLELVKPALATTNQIPIFQCFIFKPGFVEAYDDQIAITGPCDGEQEFAVPGNTLLGLLSNSGAEEISLDLKSDILVLTMSKSVSKLAFQPPESFIFQEPDPKWNLTLPFTTGLAEAVEGCLGSVAKATTQPALNGISFEGNKLYACNGDSLTRFTIEHTAKARVLLPTAFCSAVLKLWKALDVIKGELLISDEWVSAQFGAWAVYGQILEIKDPIDFEQLITQNVKTKIPLLPVPEGLSEGLGRARILSDPESQKTVISIVGKKITLHTQTHVGATTDKFVFGGSHPDVVANVNAAHLQDALSKCDRVAFHENCCLLAKDPSLLMLLSNM